MAKEPLRIALTAQQKDQIKKATGADVDALEVSSEGAGGAKQSEAQVPPAMMPTVKVVVKGTHDYP